MNNTIKELLIISLLVFSFYYTNTITNILKNIDPLMKQIKQTTNKYEIKPINAKIKGKYIISGKKGYTIDYNKTYTKMKKYGTYNESLTTLKEIKPTISIENTYDKYIIGGNNNNRNIAIIFKVNNNPNKIKKILEKRHLKATFFIDKTYLEQNLNVINDLKKQEIELLNYDDKKLINTVSTYIETITKKKIKYCYTEKDNQELLDLCKNMNMYTIKPTLVINNNLFHNLKYNLNNSEIISLDTNSYIEKELSISLDFIKNKGYNIVTLDELLKE